MARKPVHIVPLATALAALGTIGQANDADAKVEAAPVTSFAKQNAATPADVKPNAFYNVGEELLSFVMTQQPDGSVLARHYSHQSHSSHSSHRSHYSSRY